MRNYKPLSLLVIVISLIVMLFLSSCLVGKHRMNKMLGLPEEQAVMLMYRIPDRVTEYGQYKLLIWSDNYYSPWVNKYRYTTLWVTGDGIVRAWTVRENPLPPNQISIDFLVR